MLGSTESVPQEGYQICCPSTRVPSHTGLKTTEAITKFKYTMLPHPLYRPKLHIQIFSHLEFRKTA